MSSDQITAGENSSSTLDVFVDGSKVQVLVRLTQDQENYLNGQKLESSFCFEGWGINHLHESLIGQIPSNPDTQEFPDRDIFLYSWSLDQKPYILETLNELKEDYRQE